MTEAKLTNDEIMHSEIIKLLNMVSGDPFKLAKMIGTIRYNIDHLEEIKHNPNNNKENIQYAINALRRLTLEFEELRDGMVMSSTALTFFADQYKDYINRMKNEKKDDE